VDSSGLLSTHLARAGFRFFFVPGIRKQIETEIRAQFDAFQKTGFALDHVNAHNHMHLHPTVLRLMLKVGKKYGLTAVRLPNEPPWRSSKASGKPLRPRLASWIFLSPWISLMKCFLRRARIRHNDFFFGMEDSGAMTRNLVLGIMDNLPDGITEICFHPATRRSREIDRHMPEYLHVDEFLALTDKSVIQAIQAHGIQRIAYSDL
jgi:hopanoid biosynthesis associated protein HpnK